MVEVLRALRLGTINILGITVPGLMFVVTFGAGFGAPVVLMLHHMTIIYNPNQKLSVFPELPPIGKIPLTWIAILIVIISYTIGYIIRLSTPDDLDRISGDIVQGIDRYGKKKYGGRLVGEKKIHDKNWPYHGKKEDDIFPYLHMRKYLEHRGHDELLKLVKWGEGVNVNLQRSKTIVNKMKIETSIRSPELSAIIESNEAHVRMLFGVWFVAKLCLPYLITSFLCTVSGLLVTVFTGTVLKVDSFVSSYHIWVVVIGSLLGGVVFAKYQIEQLFHYRRVRELFDIIVCTYWARKKKIVKKQ